MINRGRFNVLGVVIDAVDLEFAKEKVIAAATEGQPLGVTALAVHGVMETVRDEEMRKRVNGLDLVVPDGQPVRWALNQRPDNDLPGSCAPKRAVRKHTRGETRAKRGLRSLSHTSMLHTRGGAADGLPRPPLPPSAPGGRAAGAPRGGRRGEQRDERSSSVIGLGAAAL